MKKVLIALDYDPTAQKVAETGYSLAKTLGAEIILLHVVTDSLYYSEPGSTPGAGFMGMGPWKLLEDEGELEKQAQQYLEQAKLHLGDETIQTLLKDGHLAESILKASLDLDADIIVMGSHSRKWLEDIVMGSVTEKVLKHTSIPVFIVPTKKGK